MSINLHLWQDPKIIFNSKNEITSKTHRQPGEDAASYKYEYDSQKRPTKITEVDENSKNQRAYWAITWK